MENGDHKYTLEQITEITPWVEDKLFSFKITRPNAYRFIPGQFARLGIKPQGNSDEIIWRAYSMVSANYDDYLEFYSIVVEGGAFTSQLAELTVGDTIYVDKTPYGFLTTNEFGANHSLWLLASGTGLAPFLSILADARPWQHYRHIILVHSVREAVELTYQEKIQTLTHQDIIKHWVNDSTSLPKFTYIPVVTREPMPGALDKRINLLIEEQSLQSYAQEALDPANAHIMICGNPDMLKTLRAQLKLLGFHTSRRGVQGNLALENYW